MSDNKFDPSKPVIVSTGPITDAGKAVSSRNATKHGCCSTDTLILATESEEEFKSLESAWFRSYEPKDPAEVHLVHQLVHADWFLQRAIRTVARVEARYFDEFPDPTHWGEHHHTTLGRFLRYQTTHTNNVAKRQKAVEDYRRNRAAEAARAQTTRDKAEKLTVVKTKLKIAVDKNKPEPSWGEHLQAMRQEAIDRGFTPPPRPNDK